MRSQQPSKNLLQLTFQADGEGRGSFFRYDPETGTLSGEPGAHGAHGRKAPGAESPCGRAGFAWISSWTGP